MTKDEAIKKLIQEVKLIANCGSVEDFTVAGIRCTLRDALYRYNQMSDQPTLTDQSEESGVERAREDRAAEWKENFGDHSECSVCGTACEILFVDDEASRIRAQRRGVVEECLRLVEAWGLEKDVDRAIRERFKEELVWP